MYVMTGHTLLFAENRSPEVAAAAKSEQLRRGTVVHVVHSRGLQGY